MTNVSKLVKEIKLLLEEHDNIGKSNAEFQPVVRAVISARCSPDNIRALLDEREEFMNLFQDALSQFKHLQNGQDPYQEATCSVMIHAITDILKAAKGEDQ
ncbi:MAG: hypothetical protein COB36_12295 [Alphaproteobacteria bacterium]|nr:MAG: hypothetical protein COB36_12295 [Alphaproteobacteria bacterium]